MTINVPTLFIGDFNYILEAKNKKGGKSFKLNRKVQEFRNYVQYTGLVDLGYQGPSYTWYNNRIGLARVWKRIDWAFVSLPLLDLYPKTIVTHLTRFASNHCPLLVHLSNVASSRLRPFQFEKMWLFCGRFYDLVKNAWRVDGNHTLDIKLPMLFHKVKRAIKQWKGKVGNIFKKGQELEEQIYHIQFQELASPRISEAQHMQLLQLLRAYIGISTNKKFCDSKNYEISG